LEGLKKREIRKMIVLFIISESLLKYSRLDALGCLTDCHLSSAIYLAGGLQAH
jgi:hypothetical protein